MQRVLPSLRSRRMETDLSMELLNPMRHTVLRLPQQTNKIAVYTKLKSPEPRRKGLGRFQVNYKEISCLVE